MHGRSRLRTVLRMHAWHVHTLVDRCTWGGSLHEMSGCSWWTMTIYISPSWRTSTEYDRRTTINGTALAYVGFRILNLTVYLSVYSPHSFRIRPTSQRERTEYGLWVTFAPISNTRDFELVYTFPSWYKHAYTWCHGVTLSRLDGACER